MRNQFNLIDLGGPNNPNAKTWHIGLSDQFDFTYEGLVVCDGTYRNCVDFLLKIYNNWICLLNIRNNRPHLRKHFDYTLLNFAGHYYVIVPSKNQIGDFVNFSL